MKIKVEVINMTCPSTLFEGCKIVFEFASGVKFKQKQESMKTVTDNGGIISYILTKQCSYLIVSNKEKSDSYRCQTARKYQVPVVTVDFLHESVKADRILDVSRFYASKDDAKLENETEETLYDEPFLPLAKTLPKEEVATTVWRPNDNNLPYYNEDSFELAKYAVYHKNGNEFHLIEIHVNKVTSGSKNYKFRIYHQTYGKGSGEIEYQFAHHAEDALSLFSKILAEARSKSFEKVDSKSSIPFEAMGTRQFRQVYRRKSQRSNPGSEVNSLVSMVWKEAVGELNQIISVPVKQIQIEQVEKAEGVLLHIKEALRLNWNTKDLQNLSAQFYEALPFRTKSPIADKLTLSQRKDVCQLIRDMISVGEVTYWLPSPPAQAMYQAMGCKMEHVADTDLDYDTVSRMVLDTMEEATIMNVFTVDRSVEHDLFREDLRPAKLLFHSSKPAHFLGILSRGLLLPKLVVHEYGGTRTDVGNLGYGIYFADSASVSSQYSVPNTTWGSRFMLVAEVALGNTEEVYSSVPDLTEPSAGFDSVCGTASSPGQPSYFKDTEYAIYNNNQQRLKYLVEFTLPGDEEKNREMSFRKDQVIDIPINFDDAVSDASAIDSMDDPLTKLDCGLVGSGDAIVPLKSVHVRAKLVDLSAQVVVLQAYANDSNAAIEAKYVFPLDDMAAVCGFDAFINGKHIVGEVKEKATAHKEYKEAVSKGHGAYLMDQDQETPDVFTVSVGNLPPRATVLIKITYVAELQVVDGIINFFLPESVAPWKEKSAQQQTTQTSVDTVNVGSSSYQNTSLQISVNMPFEIKTIKSPTHSVKIKSTACKAVLELKESQTLKGGFNLEIGLSHIHVPRMWVEEHPDKPDSKACMLTFYPEADSPDGAKSSTLVTFLLDLSNSMSGNAARDAISLLMLMIRKMVGSDIELNVMLIGSESEMVFEDYYKADRYAMLDSLLSVEEKFKVTRGGTDLYHPLHNLLLLQPTRGPHNVILISDGHINDEQLIFPDLLNNITTLRLFTLGVSETANRHRLRSLARVGRGTYDYFDRKLRSKWTEKIECLLFRLSQPVMSSVKVDWQQFDNNPPTPVQAPREVMSLFSGTRQVVYGFVPNCQMATLKAVVNGQEISTVVSSSELSNTKGTILHRLTARGIIRDWEDGILSIDRNKHESEKLTLKDYIIKLSLDYSIVTQLTSFVAVEERTKDEKFSVDSGPDIEELVTAEDVDDLQYMSWQERKDVVTSVPCEFESLPDDIYVDLNDDSEDDYEDISYFQEKKDSCSEYLDKRRCLTLHQLESKAATLPDTAGLLSDNTSDVREEVYDDTEEICDFEEKDFILRCLSLHQLESKAATLPDTAELLSDDTSDVREEVYENFDFQEICDFEEKENSSDRDAYNGVYKVAARHTAHRTGIQSLDCSYIESEETGQPIPVILQQYSQTFTPQSDPTLIQSSSALATPEWEEEDESYSDVYEPLTLNRGKSKKKKTLATESGSTDSQPQAQQVTGYPSLQQASSLTKRRPTQFPSSESLMGNASATLQSNQSDNMCWSALGEISEKRLKRPARPFIQLMARRARPRHTHPLEDEKKGKSTERDPPSKASLKCFGPPITMEESSDLSSVGELKICMDLQSLKRQSRTDAFRQAKHKSLLMANLETRFNCVKIKTCEAMMGSQLPDGSWEFDSWLFKTFLLNKEICGKRLMSSGLRSLGVKVAERIQRLVATMVVLGEVFVNLFLSDFPLEITSTSFNIDMDKKRKEIMRKLELNVQDQTRFCAQVLKAVEFCDEVTREYPLMCSQLELGHSWEEFIAEIIGFDLDSMIKHVDA